MFRRSLLLCSLSLALVSTARAEGPRVIDVPPGSFAVVNGVNVRNGNYSTTFSTSKNTDAPSGIPFDRVYNSRSTYQSVYGLGWSTVMDSRILLQNDGSLALKENGVGATTKYVVQPGGAAAEYIRSSETESRRMKMLIEYEYQLNKIATLREMVTTSGYKELVRQGQLKAISEQRLREEPAFPSMGPVVPDGAVFLATKDSTFQGDDCRDKSRIVRQGERLVRIFPSGCSVASETYTLAGALVRMDALESGAGSALATTKDANTGLVKSIQDEKGKVTRFKYDTKKRLVRQDYPSGVWQGFEYDEHDNMTAIIYVDHSRSRMTYDSEDRVTLSAPRNRPSAAFEYLKDPYDSRISLTRVTLTDGDQKAVLIYRLH